MRTILLLFTFCMLLAACRKRSSDNWVGEWKLVETSHIGATWVSVSTAQEQTLILNDDGGYILNTHLASGTQGCKGTYKVEASVLTMSPECGTTPPYYGPLHMTVDANTLTLVHLITSSGFKTRYTRK